MRPATDAADPVPSLVDGLVCRGVLRHRGHGSDAATIEPQRCGGCSGRCGIRIGSARLRLERLELDDLPDGTPVEFVAARQALAGRALFVFGSPLASTALAALVGAPDWLLPCAFVVGLMLALGARFAWPRAEPDVEVQAQPCRVRVHLA